MICMYVEVRVKGKTVWVPLETVIAVATIKLVAIEGVNLVLVEQEGPVDKCVRLDEQLLSEHGMLKSSDIAPVVRDVCLPAVLNADETLCIAGLCASLRYLLKQGTTELCKQLLGFRAGCLAACAESSIWTKFCEVDMIKSTERLLQGLCVDDDRSFNMPEDFSRFGCHLGKPIRSHNIGKKKHLAKKQHDTENGGNKINSDLLQHLYAEGTDLTLADVVLYPCFYIYFVYFNSLKDAGIRMKLVQQWYSQVTNTTGLQAIVSDIIQITGDKYCNVTRIKEPDIAEESLYIKDPRRYKPRNRIFTRQEDVSLVLGKVGETWNEEVELTAMPDGCSLDWTKLPPQLHPRSGNLPPQRIQRKCQQLENMVFPILGVAQPGWTVVDFCSGGGHLGIILAYLLPQCRVIMVDNKEESVLRAKARVDSLQLTNAILYQCNMDYFCASFDIGTCLHACGVATDLVLKKCMEFRAAFIICPCCYGSVKTNHVLSYPRSKRFTGLNLSLREYLVLSHSADQTHDADNMKTPQGKLCMKLIDSDRLWHADENNYNTTLYLMKTPSCSPKNHILVGIPLSQ